MCGIIGYLGTKSAKSYLLDGLKRMEYRGYDSAGIAIFDHNQVHLYKQQGKVQALVERVEKIALEGSIGIGHTRWATHGKPSDQNAHPHTDCKQQVFCVHNGIVENNLALRVELQDQGHVFTSETDSEVIAHLIDSFLPEGSLEEAVRKTLLRLQGSYAIAVTALCDPQKMVVARKDHPLIVGVMLDGAHLIASDVCALLPHTNRVFFLENEEIAVIEFGKILVTDAEGHEVKHDLETLSIDVSEMEKQGYSHFMLKELMESPAVLRSSCEQQMLELKEDWLNVKRLVFVGCGGGYYASLFGAYLAEQQISIPSQAIAGSEFRFSLPTITRETGVIVISQSGETADTLLALRQAKQAGAKTMGLVNVMGSAIAREADEVIPLQVGPEISVASTKAMHGMIRALLSFVHAFSKIKKGEGIPNFLQAMHQLPYDMEAILSKREEIQRIATTLEIKHHLLILGKGGEFASAKEGALKFMEIAYTPTQAFSTGELKHGPLALIDEKALCIFLIPCDELYEKNRIGMEEVKARGGHIFALTTEGNTELENQVDEVFYLPSSAPEFHPILSMLVLQLLAYELAVRKGYPIDQPRHLAKSVTVE